MLRSRLSRSAVDPDRRPRGGDGCRDRRSLPAVAAPAPATSGASAVTSQSGQPALAKRVATGVQPGVTSAKASGPAASSSRSHGAPPGCVRGVGGDAGRFGGGGSHGSSGVAVRLQRDEQPGQRGHQLQRPVRAAGPGPVRGGRVRARAGQLGVPDLHHEAVSTVARPVQRQRPVQRGRQGVHQRPALLVRPDRRTPGSRRSCSSTTRSPRGAWTSRSTSPTTRPGCGTSTRSTRPSMAATASRTCRAAPASATSRGSASTRPTCTSRPTSSRSTGRSSTAARSTRSPSPTCWPVPRPRTSCGSATCTSAAPVVGAPQPALSIGTPNAEYFLSQLDPNGNG